MTVHAVKARIKTVTRRHVDTWRDLKPGDRLTLIEKGMGLPKGAKQVVLAEVEIVDVRVEPIICITGDDCKREGLGWMDPDEFIEAWLPAHGYPRWPEWKNGQITDSVLCRRIEWRYLP
jgi:hypothetical protein